MEVGNRNVTIGYLDALDQCISFARRLAGVFVQHHEMSTIKCLEKIL